jgi:hypothetical protein
MPRFLRRCFQVWGEMRCGEMRPSARTCLQSECRRWRPCRLSSSLLANKLAMTRTDYLSVLF